MGKKVTPYDRLRGVFAESLDAAFAEKFPGDECETSFNIMAMRLVTLPVDKTKFTQKQHAWIEAYSTAFNHAMEFVK